MKRIFKSPLSIGVGKRKFILNLNQYRNTHYRISNNAKIKYKEFMKSQITKYKKKLGQSLFIYTVYKGDRRNFDVGNVCAIHQKFFEDALVELGMMDDDKYSIIPMVMFVYGGIDKDNPHVEIEVVEKNKSFRGYILKRFMGIIERLY